VKDLRVLQCAALLAQAIGAQDVREAQASDAQAPAQKEGGGAAASASGVFLQAAKDNERQTSLYFQAKELAESFLPPIHPMVSLTRSLCEDRAVSASLENAPLTLPSLTTPNGSPKRKGSQGSPSRLLSQVPTLPEQKAEPSAAREEVVEAPVSFFNLDADASLGDHEDDQDQDDDHDHDHKAPKNIFAEYIADYRLEKEMTKPWFNNRQDELRKHVNETARFVRLQNHGKNMKELSDPKFTSCGHRIQIKELAKINKSRSEPALLHQCKMVGSVCPEAIMTLKLRQALDPKAKPMTQPKRRRRQGLEEP